MAVSVLNASENMTEQEFKNELKDKKNIFIITTSALDKVKEYGELFAAHEIDGLFTGSGALGMTAAKTPEMTGHYAGNIGEKQRSQLAALVENESSIRQKLSENDTSGKPLNIIGMTEDSGTSIMPADSSKTHVFVAEVKKRIRKELRPEDQWLVDSLKPDEFPGANLHPIWEHLDRGVHSLMTIFLDSADKLGIGELRYVNTAHVSFVFPQRYQDRRNVVFSIKSESGGRFLTREEYRHSLQRIDALNFDALTIPDGQAIHPPRTLYELKKTGLYEKNGSSVRADHYKVEIIDYLSKTAGTKYLNGDPTARQANIGWMTPDTPLTSKDVIEDYDAVVLRATRVEKKDSELALDENLALVLKFVVSVVINPLQKYIILDNRHTEENGGGKGPFDDIIKIFRNASVTEHRNVGELPFLIANSDEEMERHLKFVKRVTQRAPRIKNHVASASDDPLAIKMVPNDGIFTVFIAGGHNNNSRCDLEEAKQLGYMCAKNGYRIVTGAGSVEGSMGAIHTGFIQYHLDNLVTSKSNLPENVRQELDHYPGPKGKYSAEEMIVHNPALIDKLSDMNFIPRDMFYGYSMKNLLKLESISGEPPPGIRYFESGSLAKRIHHILQAGTKIIMPGGPGTDEEFLEAISKHINARKSANDFKAFSDGTPKDDGMIIVYNRDHVFDTILKHFDLIDNQGRMTRTALENKIAIVTSGKRLQSELQGRSKSWQETVSIQPTGNGTMKSA